jgi:acyl carrier protein
MNTEVLSQVQNVFRDVFDQPELVIKPETNSTHIEEWDSLAHMSLVTAIERQFKIRFALGELQALKNVGDMVQLIEKKMS